MSEIRTDVVIPEAADAAEDVQRMPGDAERTALVGSLREGPVVTDAERDHGALRTAVDTADVEDSGEVRIPRQNGKAATSAGTLTVREVAMPDDHHAAPDRYSGAQSRYELGMMPLAVGAQERAARMEGDKAARLAQHHVDAATGHAWQLLGQQPNGSGDESPYGMVARVAEKTGGSLESADTGVMQAALLRHSAITEQTRISSRGQGTDQHLNGEQQADADAEAPTGKAEKVSLTLQLNHIQHELGRTDRPLPSGQRAELQAAHDRTLAQLRDHMRAEQLAAREATAADLRAYFANTGQDAETVVGQMLYRAGDDINVAEDGQDTREEFGAMALASYAGLRGLAPLSEFPDHAATEIELLAMDAADKEHTYVQLVARHGVDSRRASTALDAAYEADRTYAAALQQALAAEQAARQLEINPLGN